MSNAIVFRKLFKLPKKTLPRFLASFQWRWMFPKHLLYPVTWLHQISALPRR